MNSSKFPTVQAKRFDRQDLGPAAVAMTESAAKGPTYLRVDGRIAFVVLAVEVFDRVWPESGRAFSTEEMPEYLWNQLIKEFERQRVDEAQTRTDHLTIVEKDPNKIGD